MRQDGYYWVKSNGRWEVSHWSESESVWDRVASEKGWHDDDFEEICERPIPQFNNIAYGGSGGGAPFGIKTP